MHIHMNLIISKAIPKGGVIRFACSRSKLKQWSPNKNKWTEIARHRDEDYGSLGQFVENVGPDIRFAFISSQMFVHRGP